MHHGLSQERFDLVFRRPDKGILEFLDLLLHFSFRFVAPAQLISASRLPK
jgi:hypothetical protein